MPGLDDAIAEIRAVEQWNREQEQLKQKVKELAKKNTRKIITDFVHKALDKNKILRYDGLFDYIDQYVEETE